ncbi:SusD/RagB family nutrient-binding outer membrane lipoprotein [Sinomicrobium oceani]|uniref:SusD/RagB family nutrient-binding outer membrane lipoprotein n=1 Tax=Sinomicrobium oceani TaxID=1150368 RepID=UPI00227D30AE|nr:SusD/RagB family nutrient-binding outer membrane lipoprotein [Sinomicrobium oceani]
MSIKSIKITALSTLFILFSMSCEDLEELNVNPNGVDPEVADLNLLLPTMLTSMASAEVNYGFGEISGVMQHTQRDGWSTGYNDYDWDNSSHSWSGLYGILRNNKIYMEKAEENEFDFHQAIALTIRAYVFGRITDLWGDAPYSEALKGDEGADDRKPRFDAQRDIYLGILTDLESANTLLSKSSGSYETIDPVQDVLFGGNVQKWRRFVNSLALRYYMRLSEKEPALAKEGVTKIASNPNRYPVILDASNDAKLIYPGTNSNDAWPTNTVFNTSSSGDYFRTKMCATLVNFMKSLEDPRLGIWANEVEIPIVIETGWEDDRDEIIDGVRHIAQNIADQYYELNNYEVDTATDYVGLPPSFGNAPAFNLNPDLSQGVYNPHASQLNDMYQETGGGLLAARLISAAEVNFILAEAGQRGWISGAQNHYNAAIEQSFAAWGVSDVVSDYLANVPYDGTLKTIIEQKWVASWSASTEAWFDYRRTGFPELQTGQIARREVLPLRFYYHFEDEISLNGENAEDAISRLEATSYLGTDSKNSAWSKMWLLQGTEKPY